MDRQKLLLIFGIAWVSAGLLTWFLYRTTRAPRTEPTVAVQAASHDMPAGTRLRKGDLKPVRIPEKDAPRLAILDDKDAIDRPLLYPVSTNEPLTQAKIAGMGSEGLPSTIEIGKRAIAVPITDSTGVAGLLQPRAHVDVLFTRPGSMAEAVTATIIEDVVVLAIGRTTETTNSATGAAAVAQAANRPSSQSVTLLVTPEQARLIELAKNQGKIGLSLRNPLDPSAAAGASTTQALYAKFPAGKGIERPAPPAPVVEKPKPVIEKIEPPAKPKRVVDIFRGDKHVQETFQ